MSKKITFARDRIIVGGKSPYYTKPVKYQGMDKGGCCCGFCGHRMEYQYPQYEPVEEYMEKGDAYKVKGLRHCINSGVGSKGKKRCLSYARGPKGSENNKPIPKRVKLGFRHCEAPEYIKVGKSGKKRCTKFKQGVKQVSAMGYYPMIMKPRKKSRWNQHIKMVASQYPGLFGPELIERAQMSYER